MEVEEASLSSFLRKELPESRGVRKARGARILLMLVSACRGGNYAARAA